ncbi:MAG: acetyl-CoA carboxylase biotin carboxyl carrier protein subunit [Burkholderiaceae bacterium]|nr:acetyl-CoA carboxylase biotin carboxyl carrier protein subunit [Burkholderiaceae bacterium]
MSTYEAKSEVTGSVWKILVAVGEHTDRDAAILIVESMKMEIPVLARQGGTVQALLVNEGETVAEGQPVARLVT